jgi:hypothetical protein
MRQKASSIQKNRGKAVIVAHFLLWIVLSVWIIYLLLALINGPSYGISLAKKKDIVVLKIYDFPSHFNFVQKAWLRETIVNSGSSVYSVKNHLQVTSDWAGQRVIAALPFGYSPTMLWVVLPLVPLPNALAFLLFNIAGLAAVFWMTRPSRCRWGIGLLIFFSALAKFCFVQGQTAILAGAGIVFIAERTLYGDPDEAWMDAVPASCVLWALTAKPPVALTAAAVLLGLRRWRTLIAAGVLTIFSTLLISPLLGAHWLADYLHLIRSYNTADAHPAFAFSLYPTLMVSLRAILNVDIGLRDNIATFVSAAVWVTALGYVVITGLRSRLPVVVLWTISILSYLLFCPHVTATEELQVVIILVLCVPLRDKLAGHELLLLVTVPMLVFMSPAPGPFFEIRLPLFLSQLALFFFLVFNGKRFESARLAEESY